MTTLLEKLDVFRHVLHDPVRSKAEARVLFEIILLLNPRKGDTAWPSYEYLAARTGLHERSIYKAIDALVQSKVLVRQRGGQGAGNTNRYKLSAKILCEAKRANSAAQENINKGALGGHPYLASKGALGGQNKGALGGQGTTLLDKSISNFTRFARSDVRANAREAHLLRNGSQEEQVGVIDPAPSYGAGRPPIQHRRLLLTEISHMSRSTRTELNAELDELLEYMLPVYNSSHPDAPLDLSAVPGPDGAFRYGKDRGKLWGAYMYARVDYLFQTLRAAVEEHYENQAVIEHPATWLMHKHWLPPDQRPKVVRYPQKFAYEGALGAETPQRRSGKANGDV